MKRYGSLGEADSQPRGKAGVKMAVFAVLCRIGVRDFSPSYRLAARVFMGLKSHAPIDLSPHVNFRFSAPFEFHRMLVTTARRKN